MNVQLLVTEAVLGDAARIADHFCANDIPVEGIRARPVGDVDYAVVEAHLHRVFSVGHASARAGAQPRNGRDAVIWSPRELTTAFGAKGASRASEHGRVLVIQRSHQAGRPRARLRVGSGSAACADTAARRELTGVWAAARFRCPNPAQSRA